MKKILSVFLLLTLLLTAFVGCKAEDTPETTAPSPLVDPTEPSAVEFSKKGLKITLPADFEDCTDRPAGRGYTFLYAGPSSGVSGMEEAKDLLPGEVTDLASYATFRAERYEVQAAQKDGIWYSVREDLSSNEPQTYISAYFEGDDCYWIVEAYTPSRVYQDDPEILWSYVTAVTFE